MTVDETFMTLVKCFDCGRITCIPINNGTKIVKCHCDSGRVIHESLIFLHPPEVLAVHISRNIEGRKFCDTAVKILSSPYFDHLVAEKYLSFTYSLFSAIHCYGNIDEQGHFNCALLSNKSVWKDFVDATIKQATYEEVTLAVVKQRRYSIK